ncbi:MAG: isoaspartyl peptidase/L-asparaginase [Planctomycetes bacterium]|nr:isoaspartyl peptidase/L-asparaginase [Planctomycetota bacterium]
MRIFFWAMVVLTGAILMDDANTSGNETKAKPKWAIAIHGGAGGDPSVWDEAKVDNRKRGLERALATGRDMLAEGQSAIDVVEAVIRVFEDDAAFNAGRGAVLTEAGRAELDASIMDGKTHACGAVAGVTRVKNPITLARRVMTETKHVLLAGPGADQFAEQQQLTLVDPDYFLGSRLSTPRPPSAKEPGAKLVDPPSFGTVGCVVLDINGNLAAGTSTGGTSKKLPGRVGDSPIVGAGTYAANDTCAVSGTGIGEEYIRNSVAFDVAAQMRYADRSMANAIDEIMTKTLKPGVGGLIAVSHRGEIVLQHNTPGMSCGAADSDGRFEVFLALEDGGAPKTRTEEPQASIAAMLGEQVRAWNAGDLDAFLKPYWHSGY